MNNSAKTRIKLAVLFVVGFVALSLSSAYGQIPTVPLHRFTEFKNDSYHFYTADQDEAASFKTRSGWVYQGIIGHVFPASAHPSGTVPLYRLVKAQKFQTNHRYTLDKAEYDKAIASHGWTGEGICCYVSSSQVAGTVALLRLYKDCKVPSDGLFGSGCEGALGGDHNFYTTNGQEKFDFIGIGYTFVRNEGFVWKEPTTGAKPVKIETGNGKSANPDTVLLNLDCTRQGIGEYRCSTPRGYETCQSYLSSGLVKACTSAANVKTQESIDKQLFALGCTRFLGRADEFICKTQNGLDLCETYRKSGMLKKCMMAKG